MISNNGLLTTVGYVFPGHKPVYALEGISLENFLVYRQGQLRSQDLPSNGPETS